MHDYPDTFGSVLKSAREQAGVTVEALAEKVNKSVRYIYRLESGEQKPSYKLLCKLVRELSIPADSIFSRIGLRTIPKWVHFCGCSVNVMSVLWK